MTSPVWTSGRRGTAERAVLTCAECGAAMRERYRCREQNWTFIWHECSRPVCAGQMLVKMPAGGTPGQAGAQAKACASARRA
jgi:hypothetical protein